MSQAIPQFEVGEQRVIPWYQSTADNLFRKKMTKTQPDSDGLVGVQVKVMFRYMGKPLYLNNQMKVVQQDV